MCTRSEVEAQNDRLLVGVPKTAVDSCGVGAAFHGSEAESPWQRRSDEAFGDV